jgi:hypothetical protein
MIVRTTAQRTIWENIIYRHKLGELVELSLPKHSRSLLPKKKKSSTLHFKMLYIVTKIFCVMMKVRLVEEVLDKTYSKLIQSYFSGFFYLKIYYTININYKICIIQLFLKILIFPLPEFEII